MAALLAEKLEGTQEGRVARDLKKGVDPSKPTSLSIINQDIDSKDILDHFAERLAKSKNFKEQAQFRQSAQEQMNRDVEQLFKKENQAKLTDSVVLSSTAAAFRKDELKKMANLDTSQDLQSTKSFQDETVLDRLEKRLSEPAKRASGQAMNTGSQQASATNAPPESERHSRIQESMRQYVSALSEDLIQQTPGKKKEVIELRERLQLYGVSSKRLSEVESRVTGFVQKDLREKIKKGFTQFALSYSTKFTPELLQSSKQYKILEEMGLDTGILHDAADIKALKDDAKRDMASFVADELDKTLIREKANGASFNDLVSAFNKFNELASVVKFDAGSYMKELGKKMTNLGLSHFVPPDAMRGQMDNDSQSGGRRKRESQEIELDSGQMTDDLRRLVIQRAIRTDVIGSIEVRYKIGRLRGKLKKSGGVSDIELGDIEREGEALAKVKLIDLVRESLEDRAALSVLEGPAFDLVRAKLKKALKALKRLDAPLPKEEFTAMRDHINRGMFSVIKEEFLKLDALSEKATSNKILSQKRKELLGVLHRLRKESSIAEEIKSESSERVSGRADGAIVEAA